MVIVALGSAGFAQTQPATFAHDQRSATGGIAEPQVAGRTELMRAAKQGDYELVFARIDAGDDVNQTNRNGGTPLMYAALGGNRRIVALILARGGEVNAAASNGWGALMIASAKGYDEIVGLLLENGADPNLSDVYLWTPLMRAVYERRLRAAEILLADPLTDVNQRGENGATALHLAASKGYTRLARLLLQHGARKGLEDEFGRTAYTFAAQHGQSDLLDLLAD
jgi:ankyrin repeat protein